MSHTRLRPSFSFTDEKLAELRRVVPEAFADGQVNWESLREALGEYLEDDDAQAEHFGLNWPGKREARKMAGTPSKGALVPQPGKGMNEESTRNVFIEGENLEVLKLLQKAYAGKVKMIYIDPPYNTGNDFVYEDDFTEPLEEYLKRTGQVDEEGKALTTNTRADGRFHSKWLSMMYPRLRLARQLLRDDGVIFVSIDDNEVHHLRSLMNEVFGDENFIAQVIVQSNPRGRQSQRFTASVHEHIVVYAKLSDRCVLSGAELSDTQVAEYKLKDEAGEKYRLLGLRQRGVAWRREDRPLMYFPIYVNPKTGKVNMGKDKDFNIEVLPKKPTGEDGRWKWGRSKCESSIAQLEAKLIEGRDEWDIFVRDYLNRSDGEERTTKLKTIWADKELNYQNGTQEVKDLFGGEVYFEYPKPVALLKRLIETGCGGDDESLVVDFFAGSGTTGHALSEVNNSDSGSRKFLMVQLPEVLGDDHPGISKGFRTIADISRERLKRAFKKNKSEAGFLSFGLGKSHYRAWRDVEGADLTALERAFAEAESPLVESWTPEGLRTEVMLLEGFPLDSRVEPLAALKKNRVERIHHEWHAHSLLVCLDQKVAPETIQALQLADGDMFICLDTAIDDQSKLRLSDKGMIKTI